MPEENTEKSRWTVRDVVQWTTAYLRSKGVTSPRLDSEVLLAHALGVDRLSLYMDLDRPLTPTERDRYRDLVRRRAGREPVALITQTREFWSIPFRVRRGVLIPRPETEILVECVLAEIRQIPSPEILEIGTGSGAVAVAVAREMPEARIVATDIDPAVIQMAALNSRQAGVSSSIRLVAADLFSPFRPGTRFDVICSNPPYVPTKEIALLEPEIVLFEPHSALDGGPDGLDLIRKLAAGAPDYLKTSGALIMEIGDQQEDCATALLTSEGCLRDVRVFRDLAGRPRVIVGKVSP